MVLAGVFEKLSQGSQSAAQALRVRSALNPMLWLCAITTPILFGAAYAFEDFRAILIYAALVPMAVTCLGFGYFAVSKPEKLQSEDYQIKHEAMQMLQLKAGTIDVSPASLNAIASGVLRQLGDNREKEE